MSKPFGVWILWGRMPSPGEEPVRYEFDTKDQLDAFLYGVDESSGWSEYDVREDGSPYIDPSETSDNEEDN
jgi:hypothetical protein